MWKKLGKKIRRSLVVEHPKHHTPHSEHSTPPPRGPSQWLTSDQKAILNGKSLIDAAQEDRREHALSNFLEQYPAYTETNRIDELRAKEFVRLDKEGIIYADYMGGCLYPDVLVKDHFEQLTTGVYGNTHSDSPSSSSSEERVRLARNAVLSYFGASSSEYVCIFTSNATAALKLVGESFPLEERSRFVVAEDSHNSVNGIRAFAERRGADVRYLEALEKGGFNEEEMIRILHDPPSAPSLVAITGQSNISGYRPDLFKLLLAAKQSGYHTVIDAAALASSSRIHLGSINSSSPSTSPNDLCGLVDGLALSFYKLFGYPTGVGALVARRDFLTKLKRPWFAGGTVDVVAMPCGITESEVEWERFEEGTVNYTSLMVIPKGLEMLGRCLDDGLPERLKALHSWLHRRLAELRHSNGVRVIRILTADPSYDSSRGQGYLLSVLFYDLNNNPLPLSQVSRRASAAKISLRTGCVCNPGGALGLLDMRAHWESIRGALDEGIVIRYRDVQDMFGWEVGVVRISLGLVSNFEDVWGILKFAESFVQ